MPLRRSPLLTPAALAARRSNALKSTGPRTPRGKAWSCLNALRHGRRSHDLRHKIERTGDPEALYLFDWLHEELLNVSECPRDWHWRRLDGLAARAWCILTGRKRRPRVKCSIRTKLESRVKTVTYTESFCVPRRLKILNRVGGGLLLVNPTPSRRRRVKMGWLPELIYVDGRPFKVRRARRRREAEVAQEPPGPGGTKFLGVEEHGTLATACEWHGTAQDAGRTPGFAADDGCPTPAHQQSCFADLATFYFSSPGDCDSLAWGFARAQADKRQALGQKDAGRKWPVSLSAPKPGARNV
ncbi:MAG TPA: hypothetical protein VG860_16650 [Terriglobia bacterium]|jgi:hypothetical protein|nr:hypothetical protein [Terriglobia bacterium]